MTRSQVQDLLRRFADLRIAVVGDFFLDKYLILDPALAEISIETGLEARQVVEIRCSPGAAGTVTNNLAALGVGRIEAIGMIGDDGEGYDLLKGLQARGIGCSHLRRLADRFTPTYTKPMVRTPSGESEIERIDIKNRAPTPRHVEDAIVSAVTDMAASGAIDAVLVADQVQERNCGTVTDHVREAMATLSQSCPVLVMADSRTRISEFRDVVVKPNRHEAAAAVGMADPETADIGSLSDIGRALSLRNRRPVFVTLGADGILACTSDAAVHVPALPLRGEIDIVGAGDSVFAGIACSLAAGATTEQAAEIGNLCASVTIHKLGTTGTASPDEILALVR